MNRAAICAALSLLTLLTYFRFPGHTYLQQDTQIYVPILEHLWDSSVLRNDILVQRAHVAYTLYDETAIALRAITGLGFDGVLALEQLIFRGLGLWGIYLIATALGLPPALALSVTAICSLGATIGGPSVLTIEYEPVPRGFAVPLLFLAVGLLLHGRFVWSGVAASAAFLIHPPTVYPFWLLYGARALRSEKRVWRGVIPLVVAIAILLIAARYQSGVKEAQEFFTRVSPEMEQLQRMRASYNWISMWWRGLLPQYLFLFAAATLGCWRLRRFMGQDAKLFLAGLPIIGMLSMPVSWLLLERLKWALIPQFQPMRALLFVTAVAVLLAAVAGFRAAQDGRWAEAFAWFALAYLIPASPRIFGLAGAVALCLAGFACVAFRWPWLVALVPFIALPLVVRNYPVVPDSDVLELSDWARKNTPKDAVFLFADSGKSSEPGAFRARALRAVYVDWKGGGQVNYLPELGQEWWSRWQKSMAGDFNYRQAGIDYVVLRKARKDQEPLHRNQSFSVYK